MDEAAATPTALARAAASAPLTLLSPDESAQLDSARRRKRRRIMTVGVGGANMIIGAIIGMLVQSAAEATGVMGPTLDTVMSQQDANFTDIRAKLDALNATSDPAERNTLRIELASLIQDQERLADRTHVELREYQRQVEALKDQVVAKGGAAGGADFWIQPGESANVGERANVLGLLGISRNGEYVQVNWQGAKRYMYPGDSIETPVGNKAGTTFFKLARDGRAGFDYVPPK